MENPLDYPKELVSRLRERASELAAIADLSPLAFRKRSWLRREVRHAPNCQKENNSGAQALRRLTMNRQAAVLQALADKIEVGHKRILAGKGEPSDWEESFQKAEKLLS